MLTFFSDYQKKSQIAFPEFSGTRVLMMPIVLGDINSVPEFLEHYKPFLINLFKMQNHDGEIGYLTIDEKEVFEGKSQRRMGMHIDGMEPRNFPHLYELGKGSHASGSWGGGSSGSWGGGSSPEDTTRPKPSPTPAPVKPHSPKPQMEGALEASPKTSGYGNGMLLVSSHTGCKAWKQWFHGIPGIEGECDHFSDQIENGTSKVLEPNTVYWLDPFCVHESLPQPQRIKRQLVRLSLPSLCGWPESCTQNPLGIMPSGNILPYRTEFMVDANYQ